MSHAILTLAQSGDWMDLVAAAVGVLIIVGGGLARALNELARKRRDSMARPQMRTLGSEGEVTLEELAVRRRTQLRGGAAPDPGGPENLTMAERVERTRAKAEYERRARQMAQARRGTPATDASQPQLQQRIEERRAQRDAQLRAKEQQETRQRRENQSRQRHDLESHRRAQVAQDQERVRREALARQQAEQARRAGELQRQQQLAADEARVRARALKQQQRVRAVTPQAAVASSGGGGERATAAARRPLTPVQAPMAMPQRSASLAMALRDSSSLRQAFILKEVLDTPVSLRGFI